MTTAAFAARSIIARTTTGVSSRKQKRGRRALFVANNTTINGDVNDAEERIIRRLNEQFSIAKSVSFEKEDEGRKSAPFASLTHENGSSAKVYLFGANCASWKQPSGDEVLFVRPDAKWDETVPIAGKHYFLCAIGFLCRLI
jgi:glucose-6-phosphate 1-epimerase